MSFNSCVFMNIYVCVYMFSCQWNAEIIYLFIRLYVCLCILYISWKLKWINHSSVACSLSERLRSVLKRAFRFCFVILNVMEGFWHYCFHVWTRVGGYLCTYREGKVVVIMKMSNTTLPHTQNSLSCQCSWKEMEIGLVLTGNKHSGKTSPAVSCDCHSVCHICGQSVIGFSFLPVGHLQFLFFPY